MTFLIIVASLTGYVIIGYGITVLAARLDGDLDVFDAGVVLFFWPLVLLYAGVCGPFFALGWLFRPLLRRAIRKQP